MAGTSLVVSPATSGRGWDGAFNVRQRDSDLEYAGFALHALMVGRMLIESVLCCVLPSLGRPGVSLRLLANRPYHQQVSHDPCHSQRRAAFVTASLCAIDSTDAIDGSVVRTGSNISAGELTCCCGSALNVRLSVR